MPIDTELAPTEWTSLDKGNAKRIVLTVCKQILQDEGLDWETIRGDYKNRHVLGVRRRICAFAWEVLCDFMSEGEVSDLLGMKRTGFRAARLAYWRCNLVSPTI